MYIARNHDNQAEYITLHLSIQVVNIVYLTSSLYVSLSVTCSILPGLVLESANSGPYLLCMADSPKMFADPVG